MRTRLGHKNVSAMPPNTILWDESIRGFCARRQFSHVITFSVLYRTQDGLQRWHKVGRYGVFTPDQARTEAARILREAALGRDPSADRKALRNSMTVTQLCSDYQADMESGRINGKKASTIRSDRSRIATHIVPKLGRYKVVSLSSEQVENFMNEMSPGNANRVTGLLGAIFTYAIKKKLRPDNPVSGVTKQPDVKRLRRLSEAEYAQLHVAIRDTQSNVVGDVILMLAVSGWRNSEARLLKWSEVDLDRRVAILGDTKSGRSVRPLSGAACEIIKRQEYSSPYVFTYQQGKPIGNLSLQWRKIGLPEFWGEVQPPASLKGLDIPSRRADFVPWKPSRRRGFGMGNPTFR